MTMTSRNVHWLRALNRQTNYPQALEKLKRWATTSNKQLPVNYERQATNSYGCKLADSCQLTYIKYLCLCAGSTCSDERRARPAASAPVVSHDIHQPVKSRRQAPVESQEPQSHATSLNGRRRIIECASASPSDKRRASPTDQAQARVVSHDVCRPLQPLNPCSVDCVKPAPFREIRSF